MRRVVHAFYTNQEHQTLDRSLQKLKELDLIQRGHISLGSVAELLKLRFQLCATKIAVTVVGNSPNFT